MEVETQPKRHTAFQIKSPKLLSDRNKAYKICSSCVVIVTIIFMEIPPMEPEIQPKRHIAVQVNFH